MDECWWEFVPSLMSVEGQKSPLSQRWFSGVQQTHTQVPPRVSNGAKLPVRREPPYGSYALIIPVRRDTTGCPKLGAQRSQSERPTRALCARNGSGTVTDRLRRLLHGRVPQQLGVKANYFDIVFYRDALVGAVYALEVQRSESHG